MINLFWIYILNTPFEKTSKFVLELSEMFQVCPVNSLGQLCVLNGLHIPLDANGALVGSD